MYFCASVCLFVCVYVFVFVFLPVCVHDQLSIKNNYVWVR